MLLEYADGGDLAKVLRDNGEAFTEKESVRWIAQVFLGLQHLHDQRLMHRDIKLENILIKGIESGGMALISDFGTLRKKTMSTYMSVKGTTYYYAPEVLSGNYDSKVDVWAVGIVLYELLTNRKQYPFEMKAGINYLNDLQKAPLRPWPANFSPRMKELLGKLLEKDPERRPSTDQVLQYPIIREAVNLITVE